MPRRRDPDLAALLSAAAKARRHAWAPYSKFKVGAAVWAGGGIFVGCNVENSAYPLSVCAERNAIAAAVVAGNRRIEAVAIVGGSDKPAAPCGGCRQVMAEFCAPETPVLYYAAVSGDSVESTVAALLPESFGASDLKEAAAESKRSSRGLAGKRRSAARRRGTRSSGQ